MALRLALVLFCLGAVLLCTWKLYDVKRKLLLVPPSASAFDVRRFGARGDGARNDTAAFQRALDAAGPRSATVDVPAGTYLLGSIVIPSHATLNIEAGGILQGSDNAADYPLTTGRWEGVEAPVHQALISAREASNIAIIGNGTIQGGAHVGKLRDPRGPTLLEFTSCRGVRIEGALTLKNENVWTLHPVYCQDVTISGLTFSTHGRTADGLDPDSCRRVRIENCAFSTSDDCIAIKSGRGLAGQIVNQPSEDITISHCRFDRGIGCIALGSEVSGGIRRVAIADCVFHHGLAAIYLKTNEARGGFVENITADHLQTEIPLLRVDTHYSHRPSPNDIPGVPGLTTLRQMHFTNITVHSNHWLRSVLAWLHPKLQPGNLVDVQGDEKRPIDGLAFANISGYNDRGFVVENVIHLQLDNIEVKCAFTPLFQLSHDELIPTAPVVLLQNQSTSR